MFYKAIVEKLKRNWPYFAFLCVLILFAVITDFNGLYGQDSYEYLRYTNCLSLFIKSGANPGSFFWPLLYPISGAILSLIFKPVLALQLISMFAFVGAAFYLKKTILLLFKPCIEDANTFVVLVFLLSPYMLRASMVVMSDMLATFFITAAFYHFLKYRESLTGRHFFAFVVFAVAAIATRYNAIVLLIVPAVCIMFSFFKNFNWKALLLSIFMSTVILLPHILLRFSHPFGFTNHYLLQGWNALNSFKNSFDTGDGYEHYAIWNLVYVFYNFFHPAFCFAGIVLIPFVITYFRDNRIKNVRVIAISIFLYALFLAGIPFQDMRFLLLSFPLIAILLFPGYKALAEYFRGNRITVLYTILIIFQLGLFYRVFKPFYYDNKVERLISQEVLKYPNMPVYTFSIDGALKTYGVKNPLINLYKIKLDTVKYDTSEKLVLFNENLFAEEWKGKNPMNNWEYIKRNFHINKIEDLPDGWALYKGE
jgi:4-amino-4-deoxy-L-arabinose transferase-like glycosyltransferase